MPEPETKDPAVTATPEIPPAEPSAAASAPQGDVAAASPKAATPQAEASAPASAAPDFAAQLAAAKAEAAANYDRFLRAAADLENFRRRMIREKEELRVAATARLMEDIYPVLDTMALAIAAARQPNADLKSLLAGIDMILAQLKTALAGHGLKEINPLGQPFDPHQHEAVSHLPNAEIKEEHVISVVRTGYSLNGRLLRPAAVVVSSGPAKEAGKV